MKWPRCSLDNTKIVCLGLMILLLSGLAGIAGAIEREPADKLAAAQYSMVGLRLGFWADMAESGNISDTTIDADLPDAGFYTEIFFDYRLAPPLFLELSMGIASRGDVVIEHNDDRYIGTLNLYPLLLQLKFSPLAGRTRSFHPFIVAGGGFVWGRQKIDIISFGPDPYYNPDIVGKTETDFIGVIGGGIDLALSEQLGLNMATKYHPVTFGNDLAGIRDYTGLAFSVGISYFLHKL